VQNLKCLSLLRARTTEKESSVCNRGVIPTKMGMDFSDLS
jgi:hypothetical protein